MAIHRLLNLDGTLYFPRGGLDDDFRECPAAPSLLMIRREDVSTCPWPMKPRYEGETAEELQRTLAIALFDERETNCEWKSGDTVELPDGTPFDFDSYLADHPEPPREY